MWKKIRPLSEWFRPQNSLLLSGGGGVLGTPQQYVALAAAIANGFITDTGPQSFFTASAIYVACASCKKRMTKIGQTWLWQLLKENTAKYWGSPPCTQSQLIPTKSWVQQYPTSPPSFKNGLHPWQGRKLVHAIHDTYYLTKVWVFKISKRAFLLQNLWLLTAQGTFFFPKREGLNISLLILHSHLEFNFWYISCPGATLLQQDVHHPVKGFYACIYWKSGGLAGYFWCLLSSRQQNIGLHVSSKSLSWVTLIHHL